VRGRVASEHLVHLFDGTRSLVETVALYLSDGWRRGDRLLVVARPANWALIAAELKTSGCPLEELVDSGRLHALDAETTLASFTIDGEPDRDAFERQVGDFVRRQCAETPAGVTAYGEMVDLLAAQGNIIAAERLESFWNDLSAQCSFRLLCGYSSSHFDDAHRTRHLDGICAHHSGAAAGTADLVGSWLLADHRARYHVG
jgi:hypothetical protein